MARSIPKVLDDDEKRQLVAVFNTRYDSGLKNRCMARLMLEAGVRVSEVAALRIGDINMATCKLEIRQAKGGKDRILWVSESLRDDIGDWLDRRPPTPPDSPDYLFSTRTGGQTTTRSIRRTITRYAERAGIAWRVSPHTLRHTFATNLLRTTGNIRMVQKALGHADLSTTMIYTHIVDDELEGALKAMGGRELA